MDPRKLHDDVIKWKHFPHYWPFVREFTGPGEFPAQKPVTRSFDVFFDLRLNKRWSKQPWGWWFETLSRQLWRHRNVGRLGKEEHVEFNPDKTGKVLYITIEKSNPMSTQMAKTLASISIRYRSDAFALDRCLIDVDLRVFVIWVQAAWTNSGTCGLNKVPEYHFEGELTSPNEYSSRPTTGAEQRCLCWFQCLIRKWSCVNHQCQFHTQIAYKPTYMTHDLYQLLLFNYWHWHKIQSQQFDNPFFGALAQSFHFRRWLCVCALKTGTSNFVNLFPTCQQVLGHMCHIWYSLWKKSLTHDNLTRAGPVKIRCVMTGMSNRRWKDPASVPKLRKILNGLKKYLQIFITD